MIEPLFLLGLSILLMAVSLIILVLAFLPVLKELGRAARSVEKLADTLKRELPPTLEAIRLTGLEISDLTNDVSEGVNSATHVVKQVDQSVSGATKQAKKFQSKTRGVVAGVKAAWKTWRRPSSRRRGIDRLPLSQRRALELQASEATSMTELSLLGKDYQEDAEVQDTPFSTHPASSSNINDDSFLPRQYQDLEQPDESV
ncbi:MAG: DUF948 domain-containing protein [Symploca sp. SIO2C1]|nr:DUF948 domain-containing protein [Symploca sp. SIO2C1]